MRINQVLPQKPTDDLHVLGGPALEDGRHTALVLEGDEEALGTAEGAFMEDRG